MKRIATIFTLIAVLMIGAFEADAQSSRKHSRGSSSSSKAKKTLVAQAVADGMTYKFYSNGEMTWGNQYSTNKTSYVEKDGAYVFSHEPMGADALIIYGDYLYNANSYPFNKDYETKSIHAIDPNDLNMWFASNGDSARKKALKNVIVRFDAAKKALVYNVGNGECYLYLNKISDSYREPVTWVKKP